MDTANPSLSSPVEAIEPAALRALQGRADAPWLIDVRRTPAFEKSKRLIAGALHVPPEALAARAADISSSLRGVATVAVAEAPAAPAALTYCVYGHGVGAQAALDLRQAGWQAQPLAGGIEGGEDGVDDAAAIAQWRAAQPITIVKRPDLGVTGKWDDHPSRWVTRERPKIDRIACPWLIRRFVDPRAEFFYVPTERVFDEAQRLGAVAYDIPGAPISHEGECCSFDALVKAFDLRDAALDLMATIVRGADTDRLDLAPQSAGLLAFSLGLSRLHASDDQAMLQAAMPLYDALFAWCRDRVAHSDEGHNWRPETMGTPR